MVEHVLKIISTNNYHNVQINLMYEKSHVAFYVIGNNGDTSI